MAVSMLYEAHFVELNIEMFSCSSKHTNAPMDHVSSPEKYGDQLLFISDKWQRFRSADNSVFDCTLLRMVT